MSSPNAQNNHACNKYSVSLVHPGCWHQHTSVIRNTRTGKCYICWDECDSSCDWDFMSNNSHFTNELNLNNCKSSDPGEVFQHVKGGEELESTTAPSGEPIQPQLSMRKGPYAVGEQLQLTVQLNDANGVLAKDDGQIIAPTKATFTISQLGSTLTQVQGQLNSDGTVTANVTIPKSTSMLSNLGIGSSYTVEVKVESDSLPKGYTLITDVDSQSIPISECINSLALNLSQKTIASQIPVTLNAVMQPDEIADSSLVYEITILDPSTLQDPSVSTWSIPADASGHATWTPPVLTQAFLKTPVSIYVTGTKEGATICPSPTQNVSLSGQSVLPEVLLPLENVPPIDDDLGLYGNTVYCITGEECKVSVHFAKQANVPTPILDAPDSTVKVLHNSGDVLFQGPTQETFEFTFTPEQKGHISPKIQLESKSLKQQTSLDMTTIEVRDPIAFGLANPINFGFVTEANWQDKCKVINTEQAGLLPNDAIRFQVKDMKPGCNMEVLYLNNPSNKQFVDAIPIAIDDNGNGKIDFLLPNTKEFGLCVRTDACGADNSTPNNSVSIIPLDPRMRRFAHTANAEWTSEKEPFWKWDCWGEILTYTFSALGLLLYTYGFSTTSRFSFHQQVQVSTSKRMSRNVYSHQLSQISKRKLKLFKGEQVHLDNYLEPSYKKGVMTFTATSFGFEVSAPGIQELNNTTWEEIEGPFIPASSKLYRIETDRTYYLKFFT